MSYYGPDRWLYPVEIVAGQNVLRIYDSVLASTVSATVPAGTYYQGVGLPSGYASLVDAMRTAINTAIGVPLAIIATTSTPSSQTSAILNNSAVRYQRATGFIRFQFADAGFTFPRRLLGWPASANTNTGDDPPPIVSMLGSWQTFNMLDGAATDKRRTEMRELYASTQDLYPTTRQHSARDVRRVRKFVYDFVPGLHVYESVDRALDADYVATSGLASEDANNAFESVWDAAALLKDIIIVHDTGSGSALTSVTSQTYEIARLYLPEQRADFRACFSDLSLGGELYRIDVDMLIIGGNYEY
jgi:hypothetical protein